MEINKHFEYYDYQKNKIKILKIFFKQNKKDEKIYQKIIEYTNNYFLRKGKFHQKIKKSIEINIPLPVKDNKIKLINIDKNIQNNINNFLSISIKIKKKNIDYYYLLNKSIDNNIIIIKDNYDKFHFYSKDLKGYSKNNIYYTIEEYTYVSHNYITISMINRIIYLYIIMIFISIFVIPLTFLLIRT